MSAITRFPSIALMLSLPMKRGTSFNNQLGSVIYRHVVWHVNDGKTPVVVGSGNTTFRFVARNALLSFLNSIVEIGNFLFIGCHTLTHRFSEYLLILKFPVRFFHVVLELLNKTPELDSAQCPRPIPRMQP